MKNLVFNLRNAKAQAGCAKSNNRNHYSLPFWEGSGLGFLWVGLLTLLLTLGVGNVWGWSFSGTSYMYFHNKGGWTDTGKMLFIGQSDYSSVYTMSAVTGHTTLWVVQLPSSGWGDASYMAVAGAGSVWGSGNWGPSNRTNATHYTNTYTSGLDASNTQRYIFIPASTSNNANISLTYLGTSDPNYTITVKAKISTNNGSSYSEASSPGTLSASSKKFTTYNSCNSATSLSSGTGGTITCGYLYSTTLTAPSTDPTGYTFVGWYNSSGTQQTTNKTLTITPTADATYYAYYKAKQYSGTINANGGAADKTYTATYGVGTLTIATAPTRTGYNLSGYYKEAGCTNLVANTSKTLQNSTTYTNASGKWTYTSAPTLYAGWTAKTYNISLDREGATTGSTSVTMTYNSSTHSSITMPTKTGYNFGGYWSADNGTGSMVMNASGVLQANVDGYTGAGGIWTKDATCTLYAKWTAKTTTITYSQSGAGYGSGGPSTTKTATYASAMPSISGSVPVAANGYAFMGYYDGENGTGTQYYTSTGASARTWNKTASTATLYAYFKKAEISLSLTGSGTVSPGVTVTATPTIAPTPQGTTKICWKLLYNNGNLYCDDCFTPGSGNAVTFTAPASGHYKVQAILRLGSTCDGTPIDTAYADLVIATDHTVTIKYMCGDEEIKARTTMTGKPLAWTSVSAPDITGYAFERWVAGDGVELRYDPTTNSNGIKAFYDGTLTAKYTKRKVIFFKNTLGWTSTPYVYFYKEGGYWDASKGAGCNGDACLNKALPHAMTNISGTDIWYYDYTDDGYANQVTRFVAFTWGSQSDANFHNIDAVYPTRNDYSYGYNAGSPMFVPLSKSAQTVETVNTAKYYSRGYWVNYLGENTGYSLLIYNAAGNQELKRIRFTPSANKTMPMKVVVDLEANHSYQYEVLRDDGIYYKYNSKTLNESNKGPYTLSTSTPSKGTMQTNGAGDYTFTLGYDETNLLTISLTTPIAVGDFRIVYSDNATWSRGVAHTRGTWIMPSHTIKARANGVDTVSFFISKSNSPEIRWQKATAVSTSSVTWGTSGSWITDIASGVSESGVYNFRVVQNTDGTGISSITNIGAYTGNYYIRCDAANSKWDHYATDPDNMMTYSAFSISDENEFGPKYSHYNCHWCERGTNVKFCIANDYSPSISDTLTKDNPDKFSNIDNYGFLKNDGSGDATTDRYSANIRFMWNEKTNWIGRAYVASSTNAARQFLVLKGCGTIKNSDGSALSGAGESSDDKRAIFQDDQDFIYERMIQIQPTTRAKVYACYAEATANPANAQYFRGAYDSGNCSSESNSIQILGGSGSTFYKVRVVYDFKTNRLICAWMPNGEDLSNLEVDADVMIIRDHQEAAEAITFVDNTKTLSAVKYVYGVMRFNRWTLNNRARGKGGADDQAVEHCNTPAAISEYHPVLPVANQKSLYERALYFISFPFDVQLSEVFGLGTYGVHWVISEYNGLRRAQQGYFEDNCFNEDCTNWDYIWNRQGVTLHANQGYLLSLEIDSMLYDNTNFWLNNISQKELYFPSAAPVGSITTTEVTMPELGSDYICTKNYNFDGEHPRQDRRIYDSYWRCIGTPSYASYGALLKKDNSSGADVSWQTNYSWRADFKDFPFLYEWNVDDNSLSAQSTKRFTFKPMHAYLVQNGNAIYWSAVSATPATPVARRQRAAEDEDEYNWLITLSRETTHDDQTYIRMTDEDGVTDDFDFGQDLSKELNYGHSDIYTLVGETRVAANSIPMNTTTKTIIPLGMNIKFNGYHTISLPEGGYGVGVDLVDLYTGERTNLSAGFCYSFLAEKGILDDRFQVEISPAPEVYTDIEEIQVGNNEASKNVARKVLINGQLYIIRDGKMYDARGVRVE